MSAAEDYLSTLRGDGDEEIETIEDVEEETMENGAESDGEDNDFGASNTALTDEEKMRIMREQMGDEYVIEDLQPEKKQTYTQEEIRSLTDTKNLFQSPLFRFSFAEVLKKVSLNWKKCSKIEDALRDMKGVLDGISQYKVTKLSEIYPSNFIKISAAVQKMQCNAPQAMSMVGSYLLRTVAKPYKNVDVTLTMPKGYVTTKDYGKLYFEKRAYYLCAVAESLKKHELFSNIEIQPFRGDLWKPIIVIHLKVGKNQFKIRILPVVELDCFSKHITPNEIKQYHRIAEDQYFQKHLELLHNEMKDCPVLVETSILLRVWSRNRNIYQSDDSLNGFLFSILLIYLLAQKKINKTMSSFQMIKLMMNWIVKSDDAMAKGLSLTGRSIDPVFTKAFDVVLVDPSCDFNIFHRVSRNAWREIKSEAKLTLEHMKDENNSRSIELLFLTKHNFWNKFDLILNISLPSIKNDGETTVIQQVSSILSRGLEDRIKYLRCVSNSDDRIHVGLMLKKKSWFETLVRGPSPHNKEKVEEFKNFWGKKAFMKDFSDGSLSFCTEWEINSSDNTIQIIENICNYLLKKHVEKNVQCSVTASEIYSLLGCSKEDSESEKTKMKEAFEKLEETIMETDINLIPQGLSVISPEFYQLSIGKKSKKPLLTILEFRSNARWPDNVEALEKLKQLIYLKYSEVLNMECTPTKRWIDIVCEGYVFRVVIFVSKEISVIKRSGQALNANVSELEKTFTIIPLHCKYSNIFNSEFREYSETVRLAKLWIDTHLMSEYIESYVVELLCMHIFSDYNSPYALPKTALAAFFRFLNLISTFTWFETPLFVNTSRDRDERENIQREVARRTSQYEVMDDKPSMFIAATYDMDYCWTKTNPPAIIVHRMVQFAKNTEIELLEYLQNPGMALPTLLKETDMESYDMTIRLKKDLEGFGFNPVDSFFRDLKERFGRFGLLFKDEASTKIAIALNPEVLSPKPASIANTTCMKPVMGGASKQLRVEPNLAQLVYEMQKMGEGLISSMDISDASPLAPHSTAIKTSATMQEAKTQRDRDVKQPSKKQKK